MLVKTALFSIFCSLSISIASAASLNDDLDARFARQEQREAAAYRTSLVQSRMNVAKSLLQTAVIKVESHRILCAYATAQGSIEGVWDTEAFLAKTGSGKVCLISKCPHAQPLGETFLVNYCK